VNIAFTCDHRQRSTFISIDFGIARKLEECEGSKMRRAVDKRANKGGGRDIKNGSEHEFKTKLHAERGNVRGSLFYLKDVESPRYKLNI
jgi:hypothetical protein